MGIAKGHTDWLRWRMAYAGGVTVRQLCIDSGVPRETMERLIREQGWTRTGEVHSVVEQRLAQHILTPEIQRKYEMVSELTVEALAAVRTALVLDHKGGIERLRAGVETLTGELLDAHTAASADDEEDGERVTPSRREARKLASLNVRSEILKKLADAYKVLVGMERQAHGISDNANGEADKPKEVALTSNDYARRLAFVLDQASRETQVIEGERVDE